MFAGKEKSAENREGTWRESQDWMEKTQLFGRPIKKIQTNKESSVSLFCAASNLLP